MENKTRPLWNILGCLPHARVQRDVLGAEGDPSAGCALLDVTVTWILCTAIELYWLLI